jgi:hypothetical protein
MRPMKLKMVGYLKKEELGGKGTLAALDLDCEISVLDIAPLELYPDTGARLLYMDNRDEPPHYSCQYV